MSEHCAAAHISGLYAVLAAIVAGVLGLFSGWILRDTTQPTTTPELHSPQLESPDHATEANNDSLPTRARNTVARLGSDKTDFGALLQKNEPKQENAEPSEITMEAYYRLLEDEGLPQLDVAKQYIGKRVGWTGFFYSLDTYPNSNAQRYRVLLTHHPERFHDYLYFYQSVDDEPQVAKLRKGAKVRVSGVLSGRTTLSDARIESVNSTQ